MGESSGEGQVGVGWFLRVNGSSAQDSGRREGGSPVGCWATIRGGARGLSGAGVDSRSRASSPLCICSRHSSGHPPSQDPWESGTFTHLHQGVRNLTHVTTSRVICIRKVASRRKHYF